MRARIIARVLGVIVCGALATVLVSSCGGGSSGGDDGGVPPPPPPPPPPTLPTQTSSSQTSYATMTASGWQVVPLLTVGDTPTGSSYAMAGKPDGLGAVAGRYNATGQLVDTSDYLTVFMNHEFPPNQGVARAHGTRGAFVSQWTLELDTLRTVEGRDLVTRIFVFNGGNWSEAIGTVTFNRLCSADLPARAALYNAQSGNGYDGQLFLNGEEVLEGQAFAHVIGGPDHGTTYELPYVGRYSHENVVANPGSGDTTLVVSQDDDGPGQVYVYAGTKRNSGNPAERAGLHGGKLYGIRVTDGGANYSNGAVGRENNGGINGRFDLADVTDAALGTGANLQAVSVVRGITEFARPEDGAWDARDPRTFYLATTGQTFDGGTQSARLYKLVFDSVQNPTGGTIEVVMDSANVTGGDGNLGRGFDNVTVDGAGRVIVQEDDGGADYVAKTWMYDPAGSPQQILEADRNRFLPGGTAFLTSVEEHSGVIEVTEQVQGASWFESGRRYYLGTLQAHYPTTEAFFEGGQYHLFVSPR